MIRKHKVWSKLGEKWETCPSWIDENGDVYFLSDLPFVKVRGKTFNSNNHEVVSCLGSFCNTEIYEKDFVLLKHWKSSDIFNYNNPFLVTYRDGQICFLQGGFYNFIGSLGGKLEIDVIGNLFNNPELLEQTK